MAGKSNIRSIRISDQMAELIDQQTGSNFTEKWENLVTRCIWELPQREKEIKQIEEEITSKRAKLRQLSDRARKYEQALDNMKWDMQRLGGAISQAAEEV